MAAERREGEWVVEERETASAGVAKDLVKLTCDAIRKQGSRCNLSIDYLVREENCTRNIWNVLIELD